MADKIRTSRPVEEINAQLAAISADVYPENVVLCYVRLDDLREQEVNPRSMTQAAINQLSENIKESGVVESLPLCAKVDGVIYIVSGHHRVRAARTAGHEYIMVLLYTKITLSEMYSKQLSHNAISGKDDAEMMKKVWERIEDVQQRFRSFVDPRIFDDIPKPVKFTQIDVDYSKLAVGISFVFLGSQADNMEKAIDKIMGKSSPDRIYMAHRDDFDQWREAIEKNTGGAEYTICANGNSRNGKHRFGVFPGTRRAANRLSGLKA